MNNLNYFGIGLFLGSLVVFTIYMLGVYIPSIQANPTNSDIILKALYWGLGCGVMGTIGATLAKIK